MFLKTETVLRIIENLLLGPLIQPLILVKDDVQSI